MNIRTPPPQPSPLKGNEVKFFSLDLLALLAGTALPFAFAPFQCWIIAILSPALLLTTWLPSTPKRAFWRGLLFGIGLFSVGASWIFVSIHTYGNTLLAVAILITVLFILFLAAWIGIQGWFLTYCFPQNNWHKLLLAFPASWVLGEWIRSWILSGFPWLFLGYSQINSPLRGLAPILSVYGVSFATAGTSAAVVTLFYIFSKRLKLTVGILLFGIWLGCGLLTTIRWTQPQGAPLTASLIQGNVPILMKWDVAQLQKTLMLYKNLTQQHWDSQIIVWPEAAITLYNSQAQTYLTQLAAEANKHHTAIITGIPIFSDNDAYNGMITVGAGKGVYLKRHLVPFGEYIPLQNWLGGLLQFLNLPMSDFRSGPSHQPPLQVHGILVAPFICYEIAYPNQVLADFPAAQLMVVVTEDGWFGKSFAAAQQLQISQMRALETGRYVLSATNTGITAIINPQGKIISTAPHFQTRVATGTVRAMIGSTPVMYGNIYPCIILMVILLGVARGKQDGERTLLLKLLQRKFSAIPERYLQLLTQADADMLLIWAERVVEVNNLEEIFGE
jgi:apolipoprotein N-acyltransferase